MAPHSQEQIAMKLLDKKNVSIHLKIILQILDAKARRTIHVNNVSSHMAQ